jgi:hypothetical protein
MEEAMFYITLAKAKLLAFVEINQMELNSL